MKDRTVWFLGTALCMGFAFAAIAADSDGRPAGAQELAAQTAFLADNPGTHFYEAQGRVTTVYGHAFSFGDTPAASADAFRAGHADVFGVSADNLNQQGVLPVMFVDERNDYKFYRVTYQQAKDGLPVFRGVLHLLVRNDDGYPLVMASADLYRLGDFTADQSIDWDAAAALGMATANKRGLMNTSKPERIIFAGVNGNAVEPTLAVTFNANNEQPGVAASKDVLLVTDASTGAILHEETNIHHVDVDGNVQGMTTQGPATDECEEEVPTDMSYARVNIVGGNVAFADIDGDYVISNGGSSDVTVESRVWGQYFRVFNAGSSDALLSQVVTPPGPADFMHNAPNTDEFRRAEVNGYVHSNVVRDMVIQWNPTFPSIANETEFTVRVNRSDGFCPQNAWYSSSDQSINFCRKDGSALNTAWTSVIYHEYGHRIVNAAGSGQGQYGEGYGDVMSTVLLDDSRLGLGFFGNCNSPLRNADNTKQYPCSGAIHDCGQLLSGCVWDTRNELIITEPVDYLDIIQHLSVNSVLMHNGDLIAPDITIAFLTFDDDDENIGNGTPHRNEICTGFGAHNMDCPPLEAIAFEYPDGLPELATPGQETTIRVDVVGVSDVPVPGSGEVSHRIGGGGFTTESMAEQADNQYTATLPAAECGETVNYYFTADSEGGATQTDPPNAPASFFSVLAATGFSTTFLDDFESDNGWTVTGNATDGQWERGVPAGGGGRGDPPTDGDGSGSCYVTDNLAGNSDVDGGSTILTSPILDATGDTGVSYYRWYDNTFGDDPMADIFEVEVSDDGGTTWFELETVGPAGEEVSGGWFYKTFVLADVAGFERNNQFRIRFTASDLGPGSVVEAGVDGVEVFELECDVDCPEDLDGSGSIDFGDILEVLAAWGNAGGPEDLDGSGTVDFGDLLIILAEWGPC